MKKFLTMMVALVMVTCCPSCSSSDDDVKSVKKTIDHIAGTYDVETKESGNDGEVYFTDYGTLTIASGKSEYTVTFVYVGDDEPEINQTIKFDDTKVKDNVIYSMYSFYDEEDEMDVTANLTITYGGGNVHIVIEEDWNGYKYRYSINSDFEIEE